jgi:hypothetical protein
MESLTCCSIGSLGTRSRRRRGGVPLRINVYEKELREAGSLLRRCEGRGNAFFE